MIFLTDTGTINYDFIDFFMQTDKINSDVMVDKILEMGQEAELLLSDDDLFGSGSDSSDGDSSSSRDRLIPRSEFEGMPLEYPSYVKSNVKPGCYVKLLLSPISPSGGRSLGDDFIAGAGSVGIVTSVRPDALLNELGFQNFRKFGWVTF